MILYYYYRAGQWRDPTEGKNRDLNFVKEFQVSQLSKDNIQRYENIPQKTDITRRGTSPLRGNQLGIVNEAKVYDVKQYLLAPHPERTVENANKVYSQAKQDQVVYNITKKDGGFFVDIGAHDGQFLSNSLWLERKHKWTGLLIEANPDLCQRIDALKRHAWRMCACLSSTMKSVSFIKGDTVGGIEQHIDKDHMKMLNKTNKITVPCFSLEAALAEVKNTHIDFFSLDVEGAEMAILESLQSGLKSKQFTVDVWSIEYRVWDGKKVVVEKSLENLDGLRKYFQTLGGYFEHSQLSNDGNYKDGYALDVVFVRNEMWCKSRDRLPDGTPCSN
jgi:FkbM family methyltransferase